MQARIAWNDLKGSPLLSVTTWLFMAVSAFLFALTCFLAIGLLGSVDTLMLAARTPDFLQMHAGEIDEAALVQFAQEQEQVRDYQVLRFLNLENSAITLGGGSGGGAGDVRGGGSVHLAAGVGGAKRYLPGKSPWRYG